MVDNIVLGSIRAGGEAGMTGSINPLNRVLVEDAAVAVLAPGLVLHRVVPYEFQQAKTVEGGVDAGGGVYDKVLASCGVGELLGTFIGGQAGVWATVGDTLPRLVGDGNDAPIFESCVDCPGVGHMGDA